MEENSNALPGQRAPISTIQHSENISHEEHFQNEVLRPIIKMKSDLLIACFKSYTSTHKIPFANLNDEKKVAFVENAFGQDQTLRSELRGVVIGYFTLLEFQEYVLIRKAINKRIISIIKKRVIDHLDQM